MKKLWTTFFLAVFLSLHCPAQGSWMQKADLGADARLDAVGFSIGNKGYIGGGRNTTIPADFDDFWEFDPITNTWTQKANIPGGYRHVPVGFSIGVKGYVGTGMGSLVGGSYLNDFWEFDPIANTWTQKANFAGGVRSDAVGFSIGSKGYVGTGYDGSLKYNDFWEFDPTANTWTQKTNVGGPQRFRGVGFSIGNKGYIGLGNDILFGSFYDLWEWDQASDTWSQKADFPTIGRFWTVGFSIGPKGYVGTGFDGNPAIYADFWEYKPSINTWSQLADFGGGYRFSAVGFSIGSFGYLGTGMDSIERNDLWEFNPTVTDMHETSDSRNFTIYPNPFSDRATLSIDKLGADEEITIQMYDVRGNKISTRIERNKNEFVICRGELKSGVYFIRAENRSTVISEKIIITD